MGGLLKKALNSGAKSASSLFGSQLEEQRAKRLEAVRQKNKVSTLEKRDELTRGREADARAYEQENQPTYNDFYVGDDGSFNQDGSGTYAGQIDTQTGKRVHVSPDSKTDKPTVKKMTDEMGNDYLAERMPDGSWQRMDIGGGPVPERVLAEADQYAEEKVNNKAGVFSTDGSDFEEFGGDREAARSHYRNEYLQQSGHGGQPSQSEYQSPSMRQPDPGGQQQPGSTEPRSAPKPPESLDEGVQMVLQHNPGMSQDQAAAKVLERFPDLESGGGGEERPPKYDPESAELQTKGGTLDRLQEVGHKSFVNPAKNTFKAGSDVVGGAASGVAGMMSAAKARRAYHDQKQQGYSDSLIDPEILQAMIQTTDDEALKKKLIAALGEQQQSAAR